MCCKNSCEQRYFTTDAIRHVIFKRSNSFLEIDGNILKKVVFQRTIKVREPK